MARAVPTLPHGAVFAPEGHALAVAGRLRLRARGAGRCCWCATGEAREAGARASPSTASCPAAAGRWRRWPTGACWSSAPAASRSASTPRAPSASFELRRRPTAAVVGLARTLGAQRGALFRLDLGRLDAGRPGHRRGDRRVRRGAGRRQAFAYSVTGQAGHRALPRAATGADGRSRVAEGARAFGFSPDGAALAWISDAAPGTAGGPARWPRPGARRSGSGARWASIAGPRRRRGWPGSSSTTRAAAPACSAWAARALAPRTFGKNVTDFELSPDGARVAFLRHTVEGGYSVDLWAGEVAGRAAQGGRAASSASPSRPTAAGSTTGPAAPGTATPATWSGWPTGGARRRSPRRSPAA